MHKAANILSHDDNVKDDDTSSEGSARLGRIKHAWWAQCDQFRIFLKSLCNKYTFKKAQIFSDFLGNFEMALFRSKLLWLLFWQL